MLDLTTPCESYARSSLANRSWNSGDGSTGRDCDSGQLVYPIRGRGFHGFTVVDRQRDGHLAVGGIRLQHYPSSEAALDDCRRLARAMTDKIDRAHLPFDGCKTVINCDPNRAPRSSIHEAIAELLIEQQGRILVGGDVNFRGDDLREVAWVLARRVEPGSSVHASVAPFFEDEISIATAWGCFGALEALLDATGWRDLRVFVQGAGSVGGALIDLLLRAPAVSRIFVYDSDPATLHRATRDGVEPVPASFGENGDFDILMPCAVGGTLSADFVKRLSCRAIVGSANNQVVAAQQEEVDALLRERGITYIEDAVANSGGVTFVTHHFLSQPKDYDAIRALMKQRTAALLHQRTVVEQYDAANGLGFYEIVMGDFGSNIHYGIYETPQDDISQATKNIIHRMAAATLGEWRWGGRDQDRRPEVLDLGSGLGGADHVLAADYGCRVTAVNLCPEQNSANRKAVSALGLDGMVDVREGDFEDLPSGWNERFDLVWSEEAFCHSANKEALFRGVARVLRAGGQVAFTDIMAQDLAAADDLRTFTERNSVTQMVTPGDYLSLLRGCGFVNVSYRDLSHQLPENFRRMILQIDRHRDELLGRGVSDEYLRQFRASLVSRVEAARRGTFAWGIFVGQKPESFADPSLSQYVGPATTHRVPVVALDERSFSAFGEPVRFSGDTPVEEQVLQVAIGVLGEGERRSALPAGASFSAAGFVSGVMEVGRSGPAVHATNEVLERTDERIAWVQERTCFLEWFNAHRRGGQLFYSDGEPFVLVVAPAVERPSTADFVAFVADGRSAVVIKPGVWHTNPLPIGGEKIRLLTRQRPREEDETVDVHLAREERSWLRVDLEWADAVAASCDRWSRDG